MSVPKEDSSALRSKNTIDPANGPLLLEASLQKVIESNALTIWTRNNAGHVNQKIDNYRFSKTCWRIAAEAVCAYKHFTPHLSAPYM